MDFINIHTSITWWLMFMEGSKWIILFVYRKNIWETYIHLSIHWNFDKIWPWMIKFNKIMQAIVYSISKHAQHNWLLWHDIILIVANKNVKYNYANFNYPLKKRIEFFSLYNIVNKMLFLFLLIKPSSYYWHINIPIEITNLPSLIN